MAERLTQKGIDDGLAELTDWAQDGDSIRRAVEASSFLEGISLVQRVAEAAESANHHPDIDIRYTTITFTLSTHSAGGLTDNDLQLARQIDRLAQAG
jgi:4a-hydroxytetrahydrobiopterin dehydratase